ncbi:MAG: PQQ-binding-like beta-propeller repeat protein [Phycisphaerae bacterium]
MTTTLTLHAAARLPAAAALLVLAAGAAAAENPADHPGGYWPGLHGPNRDNMSAETGLLDRWPEDGPPLVWTFTESGRGYACPSVAGGRLFTSRDFDREEYVLALDLDDNLLWKTHNGKAWRGPEPGARTTPTWSDGILYHLGPHGRLAALEAETGKEVWAVNLVEAFGTRRSTWGLAENVLVEDDKVLCVPGGTRGRVVALDKKTGRPVWVNTTIDDDQAYCSPVIATHGGRRQLLILMKKTVVGVDVETGRHLWSHPHPNRYNQNVDTPLYHDGRVFVTSGHQAGGRLIEIGPDGRSAREVWYCPEFDNCHGGVLLRDGHLYGVGCRMYHKGLLCVDWDTGEVAYRHEPVGKVSLTWADGRIYGVGQKGEVRLVRADPKGAEIVSEFQIPPVPTKDHLLAHPVVCGGRLYIRHADHLLAYDIRKR